MRVVRVTQFGGPEVLEVFEAPAAEAGAGEVVVEVEAAEVLFLDTQLRAGWGQEFFKLEPPFVLGAGVAGTVEGQRVIAGTGGIGTYQGGGYAEQAVVPAAEVFPIPDGVPTTVALAALHDGATALAQLERGKLTGGERVLVTAATGSLGNWLVPLLAATGTTVIAAARGTEKLKRAKELGAHEVVDYSVAGWAEQIGAVDVVFDATGGEIGRAAYAITASGGRFLAYGSASGEFTAGDRDDVDVAALFQPEPDEWRELTRRALDVLARGELTPTIGQAVPLTAAAAAHAAIEARTTLGKTLLLP
ncbi:zinc-binding dehydrogenase [Kribbella sp. NPDC026611]|uniref:zinc-binding dehydrogenase n=1 Tax=Kribbella sp. NPDC026611 TaxID=3154911 RepID=UPI0033F3A0DB